MTANEIKFIWIGNEVYIPIDKVSFIASYDKACSKRIVKQTKEAKMVLDYCGAEKKESIIVTTDGFVFVSLIEAHRIIGEYEDACRAERLKLREV
jgi:regulator of extracellular matrix RemA (YlzA/DUF370 family)